MKRILPLRVPPASGFRPWSDEETRQTLTQRFEHHAAAGPERLAFVTLGGQRLSYGELNRAANALAHELLERWGDASEPVPLVLADDVRLAVAFLAVLKAGKFYVTLDPRIPAPRLKQFLGALDARVLLCEPATKALVGQLPGSHQVLDVTAVDAAHQQNPPTAHDAARPCLVLFTSGSTDQPKGVIELHRNLMMRFRNNVHILGASADDRVSLVDSRAFGFGLAILGALVNGMALFMYDLKSEGFGRLPTWLNDNDISLFITGPSVFRAFTAALRGDERWPRVRAVQLGGEPTYASDFELFKKHFERPTMLVTGLGSVEAGTIASYVCDHDTRLSGPIVPAGYKSDGVEVELDDAETLPDKARLGELVIRSDFLSAGYWRDPQQTERVFRPDGYHTGDLVRIAEDGCMTHVGRVDCRVKIRNNPVATVEVEAALGQLPGVKRAAVVAATGPDANTHLVAFVSGAADVESAWREPLGRVLPDYMLPTLLVYLDELDSTANNKIDLGKLRTLAGELLASPPRAAAGARAGYVPPRDPLQVQIVAIWQELLRTSPIGVDDDFFALGGNSLLAARMAMAVERTCGRRLPLTELYGRATIAHIAARLVAAAEAAPVVCVQPGNGTRAPLFFCHGDLNGGGFYLRNLARALGAERAVYAVAPHGVSGDPVPPTLEAMATERLEQILRVHPEGMLHLGGYCNGAVVAYEMARQLQARGRTVGAVIMLDPPPARPPHWLVYLLVSAGRTVAALWHSRSGGAARPPAGDVTDAGARAHRPSTGAAAARRADRTAWPQRLRALLLRAWRWTPLARLRGRLFGVWDEHYGELSYRYTEVFASYRPQPLAASVTILQTGDMRPLTPLDRSGGWRRLAAATRLVDLPGDHLTSVTVHLEPLGDRVRDALAQPER